MSNNLEYLNDSFKEHIDRLTYALSMGNCSSYEEYKYTTGQIRGLMVACRIVEDLNSNLENLDD